MSCFRRYVSVLATIILCMGLFCFNVFAEAADGFSKRTEEGLPIIGNGTVLTQREWNGKTKLKANSCYFINKAVTVTENMTLPESSMIVIENGGKLTVNSGNTLYAKGAVIVHSRAVLWVKGVVYVKSTSVFVINGKLAVGSSGYVGVYGDMQISDSGSLNVKGRTIIKKDGKILCYGTVSKRSKNAVMPKYSKITDENPMYIAEEYSDYLNNDLTMVGVFDDEYTVTQKSEKLKLLRTFESVLYKYDGEFCNVSWWILNPWCSLIVSESENIYAYVNSWNGIVCNVTDDDELESSKGVFYSAALGRIDKSLFASVDPTV